MAQQPIDTELARMIELRDNCRDAYKDLVTSGAAFVQFGNRSYTRVDANFLKEQMYELESNVRRRRAQLEGKPNIFGLNIRIID